MGLFNKSATTEEEAAPSGSAVKELLPPKVTLGDTINHKRYLDEAVIKVRGLLTHPHSGTLREISSHFPGRPLIFLYTGEPLSH